MNNPMATTFLYSSLPLHHKAEIVWSKGTLIEAIETKEHDISIYFIEGLYVEVIYSIVLNEVQDIRILEESEQIKAKL
jgi:hypothetical protein